MSHTVIDTDHSSDVDHSRFGQLFVLSPDPTWIIDGNRFVECNEAAVKTLGYYSRKEFLSLHPSKLSPPKQPDGEDSYTKAERMMAIAQDQGLHRFEWVHTKANGANFFTEVTLSAIELLDRKVLYCVWRDITERKQTEILLRDSEQRYRNIVQGSIDGFLALDSEGHFMDVNEAYCELLRYSREELLKMHILDVDALQSPEEAAQHIEEILTKGRSHFETRQRSKDGELLDIEISAVSQQISGRNYIFSFLRDITERRRAFHELKRSHEDLRDLSRAASEALEAERRRTARELHDELGGELTALKMDAMWLKEMLPVGQQAIEGKLTTMQATMDMATAATRRISTNLRPMMLDDLGLIPAAEWLVENFKEHSGIDCQLQIADPSIHLMDPYATAVYRVLQEALTNVAKHAQASLVEISISRIGGDVRLDVRDNGRGFTSTDPRQPDSYGLIGLRERARLLNGEIRINSALGRGTIISLHIPIDQWDVEYQGGFKSEVQQRYDGSVAGS